MKKSLAVLVLAGLVSTACLVKQDREIGYYFLPTSSLQTWAQVAGWLNQIAYAKQYGMQFMEATFAWKDVEPTALSYNPYYLQLTNAALPTYSIKGILAFNPININQLTLPADLASRALDDPVVIARYEARLDYMMAQTPQMTWAGISIGNETETYLGTDATKWHQYTVFVQAVTSYIHTRYPGTPVGVKATFRGLTSTATAYLHGINAFTDVVYVTYFPLFSEFTSTTALAANVQTLVSEYADRRIEFLEMGFPSSEAIGSSELLQQQFIDQLFDVWDANIAQIKRMNFVSPYELTPAQLDLVAPLIGGDPISRAYWGSIGLHHADCTKKPAFNQLHAHLYFRLWSVPDIRQPSPDCSTLTF
jgi:hypothetical protein